MSNWILDTVIENLKVKIEAKKTFIDMCEFERGNYVAWNETNDTFEAKNYEYWRTAKVMAEIQLKELETELNEINDMLQEDSKEYDTLYDIAGDEIPCVGII